MIEARKITIFLYAYKQEKPRRWSYYELGQNANLQFVKDVLQVQCMRQSQTSHKHDDLGLYCKARIGLPCPTSRPFTLCLFAA